MTYMVDKIKPCRRCGTAHYGMFQGVYLHHIWCKCDPSGASSDEVYKVINEWNQGH
jgi:hypothetical protein